MTTYIVRVERWMCYTGYIEVEAEEQFEALDKAEAEERFQLEPTYEFHDQLKLYEVFDEDENELLLTTGTKPITEKV